MEIGFAYDITYEESRPTENATFFKFFILGQLFCAITMLLILVLMYPIFQKVKEDFYRVKLKIS